MWKEFRLVMVERGYLYVWVMSFLTKNTQEEVEQFLNDNFRELFVAPSTVNLAIALDKSNIEYRNPIYGRKNNTFDFTILRRIQQNRFNLNNEELWLLNEYKEKADYFYLMENHNVYDNNEEKTIKERIFNSDKDFQKQEICFLNIQKIPKESFYEEENVYKILYTKNKYRSLNIGLCDKKESFGHSELLKIKQVGREFSLEVIDEKDEIVIPPFVYSELLKYKALINLNSFKTIEDAKKCVETIIIK